jgi:DNA polymerase-3 subunit gamma/tau
MSYLALARKWRPRSFAELVGQEHVRGALSNAQPRLPRDNGHLAMMTESLGHLRSLD